MQFIDFKKDHFTQDEENNDFVIDISKDEIGFGEIKVQEKTDDDTYQEADYELEDNLDTISIRMKNPADIRVNF
jgi:hypothetical protein